MNSKPFNVFQTTDGHLVLEVGLAGFSHEEIKVERIGNYLTVSGAKTNKHEYEPAKFNFRGLSYRNFTDSFIIEPYWVTVDCELVNGVLRMVFEQKREEVSVKVGVRKQPETT